MRTNLNTNQNAAAAGSQKASQASPTSDVRRVFRAGTGSQRPQMPDGQSGLSKKDGTTTQSLGFGSSNQLFFQVKKELEQIPIPTGSNKTVFSGHLTPTDEEKVTPLLREELNKLTPEKASAFAGAEVDKLIHRFPKAFNDLKPETLAIFSQSAGIQDETMNKIIESATEHHQAKGGGDPKYSQQMIAAASGGRIGTESALLPAARSNLPSAQSKEVIFTFKSALKAKKSESDNTPAKPTAKTAAQSSAANSESVGEKKIPAWKLKRQQDAAKRAELLKSAEAARDTKIAAAESGKTTGTKPGPNDAVKVLGDLQKPSIPDTKKAEDLSAFLARPEAGKVLMDTIGSDEDKLQALFTFEKKPLNQKGLIKARDARLKVIAANLSSEQTQAAMGLKAFREIANDRMNGHSKAVADSLSPSQFGDLASQIKNKDHAEAMLSLLTRLEPDEDDDMGKASGEKLLATLAKFKTFTPEVQESFKGAAVNIKAKARNVQSDNEAAQLKALLKNLKL